LGPAPAPDQQEQLLEGVEGLDQEAQAVPLALAAVLASKS